MRIWQLAVKGLIPARNGSRGYEQHRYYNSKKAPVLSGEKATAGRATNTPRAKSPIHTLAEISLFPARLLEVGTQQLETETLRPDFEARVGRKRHGIDVLD